MNAKRIIKSIALFVTAAFAFNAIAPALAHAAKHRSIQKKEAKAEQKAKTAVIHLQGDQVNADTLVQNAYAIVTYYENNKLKREKGRIKAIGDTSFTIQNSLLGKATIAYTKVLSVVMGKDVVRAEKQMNVMRREQKKIDTQKKAIQRFKTHNAKVRFKAPLLTKKWIVGEVVKMTQDTLLIREGRTFLQVPMSSISNFEVSLGQHRNTGKGFRIGLGVGLAVSTSFFLYAGYLSEKTKDEPNNIDPLAPGLAGAYLGPFIVILSTFIGQKIKSENWVAVPPQRLNLSIAPTSAKGLRATLAVNF